MRSVQTILKRGGIVTTSKLSSMHVKVFIGKSYMSMFMKEALL